MTYRSTLCHWRPAGSLVPDLDPIARHLGLNFESVTGGLAAAEHFEATPARTVIVDFRGSTPPTEPEFFSMWRGVEQESLRALYLADTESDIPEFAPLDPKMVRLVCGPALEEQLSAQLRKLLRLETLEEDVGRRAQAAYAWGIDTLRANAAEVHHSPRVLFVGKPTRRFPEIKELLSSAGIECSAAYTDQMAFEFLATQTFDLVLLHVEQSKSSPLEFVYALRLDARFYTLPLIVTGKESQLGTGLDFFLAGADDVASTGQAGKTLLIRVQSLIEERRYLERLTSAYKSLQPRTAIDQQTGLFSHGFFMQNLKASVEAAERDALAVTLGIFRLPSLDEVNETLGYAAGDSLIRQVGGLIDGFFRGEDLCARFKGGEFAILMPRARSAEATAAFRRLVATVNATQFQITPDAPPANYSLTFGQAEYELGDTADTLINRARQLAHRQLG